MTTDSQEPDGKKRKRYIRRGKESEPNSEFKNSAGEPKEPGSTAKGGRRKRDLRFGGLSRGKGVCTQFEKGKTSFVRL